MLSSCPHSLFVTEDRASQGRMPFDLDGVAIAAKHNHACRIANLVLQTVTINKRRHDEIQRFMLLTDSATVARSEEHTSELQSLMRISYAVFCLKKKNTNHI